MPTAPDPDPASSRAGDELAIQRAVDLAQHLQLALDAGELGTWRWDLATGLTEWDDNLHRLFGLEPGEYDGTFETWLDLLHPDEREHARQVVADALEHGGSYAFDHRVVWPDGSVHWIQGRGAVVTDDEGRPLGTIGCSADITLRKQAELDAHARADAAHERAELERVQRERLEFLAGITDAALASSDHLDFMHAVAGAAVPDLGDWCALYFVPEPGGPAEVAVAHADPAKVRWAEELAGRYATRPGAAIGLREVLTTGETRFLRDVDDAVAQAAIDAAGLDPADAREALEVLELTSVITVPLVTKRAVLGAMRLVSAESGRRYTDADVTLAQAAAGRVAEALDGMWTSEQHLHIATTLQRALLPPGLPEVPGLSVAVRYWPAGASDVGGDFYDVFPVREGTWAVVIGDVCGTGPDPAAVTGIVRHTIRAAAKHGHDHPAVLDWVNLAVRESQRGLFCTAAYATVEPDGDGFTLVSTTGGHPLPVVVRADGTTEAIGAPGTLLGVLPEIRNEVVETRLGPGDVVVLYTDGVTDVPPPHGLTADGAAELFTEAVAAAEPDAEAVADQIRLALSAQLAMDRRPDDIAVIVLRVRG